MNLVEYAKKEMEIAGFYGKDSVYDGMIPEAILKIVELFADEGHSGMSASICISILEKVLRYRPLTPLTGEDSEWMEIYDGEFQNVRCFNVFKDKDGNAYNSSGRVFRDPKGCCYTNRDSRVPIFKFPYMPTTEYVDVEEIGY